MRSNYRHEEAQPNYLIHPIDIPAHHVYEEKPSRIPTFKIDVLAATAVFGVLVFMACYSFYRGFWPGGVTAILTLAFFILRLGKVFDVPFAAIKEATLQDVSPRMAPPPRSVPVNSMGQYQGDIPLRNDKTLRGSKGNIQLSGRQLDRLLKIINDQDGDGKLRRETSSLGRGVYEIAITSLQYPIFETALKENDYIDENNKFTAAGVAWVTTP